MFSRDRARRRRGRHRLRRTRQTIVGGMGGGRMEIRQTAGGLLIIVVETVALRLHGRTLEGRGLREGDCPVQGALRELRGTPLVIRSGGCRGWVVGGASRTCRTRAARSGGHVPRQGEQRPRAQALPCVGPTLGLPLDRAPCRPLGKRTQQARPQDIQSTKGGVGGGVGAGLRNVCASGEDEGVEIGGSMGMRACRGDEASIPQDSGPIVLPGPCLGQGIGIIWVGGSGQCRGSASASPGGRGGRERTLLREGRRGARGA